MFPTILSIFSEEASAAAASASFDNTGIVHHEVGTLSSSSVTPASYLDQSKTKKRRNLPGNPGREISPPKVLHMIQSYIY